jgi:hypothetical protein
LAPATNINIGGNFRGDFPAPCAFFTVGNSNDNRNIINRVKSEGIFWCVIAAKRRA